MTLSVGAYYNMADGDAVAIPQESDLFGVESARQNYFGSSQAVALGLKLLPRLADCPWLVFRGIELEQLKIEIDRLWAREPAGAQGEYWRFRLNNLRCAIALAQAHGDAGYVAIG